MAAASLKLAPMPAKVETPAGVVVKHMTPTIGAELRGVDIAALGKEDLAWLRPLLLDRKVLFFRDQDITIDQHLAFGRLWGDLETIPFLPHVEGYPEVLHIKRDENNRSFENVWHSDVSWRETPSFGSILRAIEVPEVGGDTLFADMCAAYDEMPDYLKRAAEGLFAVHSNGGLTSYVATGEADRKAVGEGIRANPPQRHPVIRTHPETGRKLIYVNRAFVQHIEGYRRDSHELLNLLYARASIPEHQCRFKWEKNSVAFWDNRACQHYAAFDYHGQRREMHRVTIKGDKPY
jgi:taurine dioxygenase